jgi:hypothetical protein
MRAFFAVMMCQKFAIEATINWHFSRRLKRRNAIVPCSQLFDQDEGRECFVPRFLATAAHALQDNGREAMLKRILLFTV